jgi:hypothetical protein
MRIILGQFADFYLCRIQGGGNKAPQSSPPPKPPLRQVFFPNRLLAGLPRLCAALYADTLLTRFLSAFGFLFSLLPF